MDLSRHRLERLREDTDIALYRARDESGSGTLLFVCGSGEDTAPIQRRLHRELDLRSKLRPEWAIMPLGLAEVEGRTGLVLADSGDVPLSLELGRPLPLRRFLTLAIGIAEALGDVHLNRLIHNDIRPANIFIGSDGRIRLSGFGLASRLARERQSDGLRDLSASALAYIAPERSGRLNRSIDYRSDLYSAGVVFYEMLVGALPFAAASAVEWVHSHVARAPAPPSVRVDGIPHSLDQIILKLLSKNAEERYQTAAGVEFDLRRCLEALGSNKNPPIFELAERDIPSSFVAPEKLYGRDEQIKVLVEAFEGVSRHACFDMLLVSGEPGIGKSALVEALRRVVLEAGAIFASGKADQFKCDVPYLTLRDALSGVFRQLLSLDDADLGIWRQRLTAALGFNARLMTDAFPELALIVGETQPVQDVSPQEAKHRFNLVFLRMIATLAQANPLVLFVDDLQWLDSASVELIDLLAGEEQIPNLMIVAAYRSETISETSRLGAVLDGIRDRRGGVQDLRLQPLTAAQIAELIADALKADAGNAHELARLVLDKTSGNPFFTVQFLSSLYADGLIRLDEETSSWTWDIAAIEHQKITDNVAVLLAERLRRLDENTRTIAAQLACLGEYADAAIFSRLLGIDEAEAREALRDLIAEQLVQRVDSRYRFAHDRIREAAYSLVAESDRPRLHLAIGRVLRASKASDRSLDLFGIVDHLNRAGRLVEEPRERLELAQLNLFAGRHAKGAAAYQSAREYLAAGLSLLPTDRRSAAKLRFELEADLADCEFMVGEIDGAEARLAALSRLSRSRAQLTAVVERQVGLYVYLGQFERAITIGLDCLRTLGVVLPRNPTPADLLDEYRRIEAALGNRSLSAIADLPRLTDPHLLQIMKALAIMFTPAGAYNPELHYLAALLMARLTVEHGVSDETPHGLACVSGQVLGWELGTFEEGKIVASAALRLIEERGFDRYASRVYAVISGTIGPWSRPLSECFALAVKATELGREHGSTTYSGYAWGVALTALMDSGRALAEVERHAEASLAIIAKLRFPLVTEFMTAQLMVARALRGGTRNIRDMSDESFNEGDYRSNLESSPHLWHALVRYRIRKLQLSFIAGDLETCLQLLEEIGDGAEQLKVFELTVYHFFSALARAALLHRGEASSEIARKHRHAIADSLRKLHNWVALCPQNFSCRAELIAAEAAALEGRMEAAASSYERGIQLAREYEFTQIEAIGCELAAHFYNQRGLSVAASAYLERARTAYERWGAAAKVQALDRNLQTGQTVAPAAADPAGPLRQLDLTAAVEMYQSLSEEILLDRLIERLMVTVVEHAGARRGLLLLLREGRLRIVAEATTADDDVKVSQRKPAHYSGELPESVLNYASRTREVIIIDDALAPNAHSGDPYILRARPRSLLCLPLVKQGKLVGILYLENDLASHSFTEDRVGVLQLVASQAAISIENAELFSDVRRKQEEVHLASKEVRRSFDMIPALAWSASRDGLLEFSNKQWHDFTGISENDAHGRTWMRAFHPDDMGKVSQKWQQLLRFHASGEFEARMRRHDGQYRRFLIRLMPMTDHRGDVLKWHGTHTDIDDLKRAEEAQEAVARASRVTAMGALTVSIAHEINQPLMAIVTNAATCLRWLDLEEPNVAEAKLAAERVVRDGHRAGDVIASIRAMASNSHRDGTQFDLGDLVREVLELTRNELDRHGIDVDMHFGSASQKLFGDRIQIQQVLLNLVLNGIEAIAAAPTADRTLEIITRRGEPGFASVAVADTGVGLQASEMNRIFDAFYTTKRDGVGIGLSICRSIIESHGGRIWAQPRRPRGSVFQFSLPVTELVEA